MRILIVATAIGLLAALAICVCVPDRASAQSYLVYDPLVIEGQIQRPQAMYIIQRAGLDFGTQIKKQNFVHLIIYEFERDEM